MELWALFDLVQPGLLGEKADFRKRYEDPIVRASHRNAKPEHKSAGQTVLARLRSLIQPYFLRREKAEVFKPDVAPVANPDPGGAPAPTASGPHRDVAMEKHRLSVRKNDLIVWVSLSEVQLELYQRFLYMPEVKEILNTSKSPLAAITILKKICQHPR